MYARGLHPGAVWKKCDFQVHTPRDPQWNGSPHLPGGNVAAESARDEWADAFVAQCAAIGLTAVAITDHHDFCFVEYIKRAVNRLPDGVPRLWIFPGIEVTCDDAVQCLVLFDTQTTELAWNRLFGGHLLNIQAPDSHAATNPQADRCGKDIEKFMNGVAADSGLNGCSIVLPHASNDGAHKSMLRDGFHVRFKQLPFDGVYTDKAFDKLDDVPKKKIHGKIKDWGNRRRGIVPTGDNRKANFERLGANACWIRLGEPTAESIRQAVLADEARIAYTQPSLPNQRILALEVDSTLTGEDFQLSFNDGFTALIGGRGSGKSAILEYLRFGLGRSAADTETEGDDSRSREQELVANTLRIGSVKVTLERDGVTETWFRSGAQRETITVTLSDGNKEELTVSAAQQRFRARAFYQKQLSTLVSDRKKAGEQITGIAAAESVDRRRLIDQEIAAAKRQVQAAFQQVIEFWVAQAEHNQSLAAVADLRRRIDAIKKRLEESGLSSAHQQLLDAAPVYNLVEALSSEAKTSIVADTDALRTRMSAIPSIDPARWVNAAHFAEVMTFLKAIETAKGAIAGALEQAITALETLATAQVALATTFKARKDAFDLEHKAAAEQQASLKSLIDESAKLVADLQTAEAAERRSAAKLKGLEQAPDGLLAARLKLADQLEVRLNILREAAAQVQGMSAESLRAAVRSEVQPEQYVSALLEICEGHGVRELQSRCEERVREILADTGATSWSATTDLVLEVYRHKLQTSAVSIEPGEPVSVTLEAALLKSVTPRQLNGIYGKLDDTRLVKLLTATHEDFIAFEYQDLNGYIPFEQASPGQQAAALLHLLLNQEAGTLIIDQPEEDLDNKVIMKIVRLVQTTKRKRQLIFATHNPNFVVNGDADKVVALTPGSTDGSGPGAGGGNPRVGIDVDGAIETALVRTAITETMEGGQAAFELRSRKYMFK